MQWKKRRKKKNIIISCNWLAKVEAQEKQIKTNEKHLKKHNTKQHTTKQRTSNVKTLQIDRVDINEKLK